MHVTVRFARALPSMREQALARTIMTQIRRANSRSWRVVQFSIQATHVHLLVEIENEVELARAMKGWGVRVAKSINQVLRRRGNVAQGRYHVHPLRTPREVRHAIAYVSCNAHKHHAISSGWDPWSSAAWFEGWSRPLGEGAVRYRERVPIPVARAQTWLPLCGVEAGRPHRGAPANLTAAWGPGQRRVRGHMRGLRGGTSAQVPRADTRPVR